MTTVDAPSEASRAVRTRTRQTGGPPQRSVDERRQDGKSARARAPRSGRAGFTPPADRRDPVAVLQQQAGSRVPELVPIRYGRMLASRFAFFRGAAAVMAADLAGDPAGRPTSGFTTQICGDAHLVNFGLYASPERRLVFDLNDFDETTTGAWEWDVERLAASLEIAGRDNGYPAEERRRVVLSAVCSYRESMHELAAMRNLDVWYQCADADDPRTIRAMGVDERGRTQVERARARARRRDSDRAVARLTETVGGQRRIRSAPPLLQPLRDILEETERVDLEQRLYGIFHAYLRTVAPDRRRLIEGFRIVDVALKVVGVGSVGTRCWIALLAGRDDQDLVFLQLKEAQESVYAPFTRRRGPRNQAERVVLGQRLMQSATDIFLGWHRSSGLDGIARDFYVRQLADWKGGPEVERIRPWGMVPYGELCAWTLARAHARSGDRVAISAYLGSGDVFDRAVADFAEAYAEQNARDHSKLVDAVAAGRVEAVTGK